MNKNGILNNLKDFLSRGSLINYQKKKVNDEELEKLKNIKERIRKIESVEELEIMEQELVTLGIISASTLSKLKRKKRRKNQNNEFYDRIRCDLETINRVIEIGKAYKKKERIREEKELIQNRDDRIKEGANKQKEKIKDEEKTRRGGGRTRGDR